MSDLDAAGRTGFDDAVSADSAAETAELAERARALDESDPLATVRERFSLPPGVVYLDGNSLGALPSAVPGRVAEAISREWGQGLIASWWDAGWWDAPQRVGELIAPLLGAAPGQVVVGDSTSVNVFRAVVAGWRLARQDDPGRTEIVVDDTTFPTDGYLAASAGRLLGARVRRAHPTDVHAFDERTAVALMNHVDYRTGRRWDLPAVTARAQQAGARIVWDLSHSAGALPVDLDRHGVDLAVGCGYKFLNGGPGAPSYLYVRSELHERLDQPLPGWSSHAEPFAMEPDYRPADGMARARGGTPEILSLLALEAALGVWQGVEIDQVRVKSLALTGFFMDCVAALTAPGRFRVLTPRDDDRGSQVSLSAPDAAELLPRLARAQVIGDHRPPDVLRFGFAPLYVGFADTLRAARILAETAGGRAPAAG
ncbi:kynureninase [Actinoalloteichus hoggarensis]|uniref:Kynureninase n=1 Tax=Actinoalloteichus hoggarensis TaxID=1470176 RepID=A0A221WB94_9PSEU|nr:aminotransferase class V-fold PLP-dependent enzyme [Actinoalloteichus hoggarensis]ASO22933.1 Kynureninase [Actinoalloteichus hoggarensis]MBB5922537.1 kynureninase [Actinoalloteichus hoggarensis]